LVSLNDFKEREMNHKPASGGKQSADNSAGKQPLPYDSAEWRAVWLRCLEAACTQWSRIPYNELALSGGDVRKLTRLVDRHYDLAEGEAQRQVTTFLRECQPRI
jgi:hypothetical protein